MSRPVWNVHIARTLAGRRLLAQRAQSERYVASDKNTHSTLIPHGASRLPAVDIEAYNIELKDDEGFVGDRANKGAFRQFIDEWRKPLAELGQDPFGDADSTELTKKK